MKTWYVGTNSYYKFCSYVLEEAPWYIYFILWLNDKADDVLSVVLFHSVIWELWWVHCYNPIFQWCYSNVKDTVIPVPWETMIEQQPKHMEEAIKESAEYEKERLADEDFDMVEYLSHKEKFNKLNTTTK